MWICIYIYIYRERERERCIYIYIYISVCVSVCNDVIWCVDVPVHDLNWDAHCSFNISPYIHKYNCINTIYRCMHIIIYVGSNTHMYIRTHAHKHTHTYKHMHTHTHTHTHTYIYIYICINVRVWWGACFWNTFMHLIFVGSLKMTFNSIRTN